MVITAKDDMRLELQALLDFFGCDATVELEEIEEGDKISNKFRFTSQDVTHFYEYTFNIDASLTDLHKKSLRKRITKNQFYSILSKELNKSLPWGSLTGVRPTKLARDLIEYGEMKEYLVAELYSVIILFQKIRQSLLQIFLKIKDA